MNDYSANLRQHTVESLIAFENRVRNGLFYHAEAVVPAESLQQSIRHLLAQSGFPGSALIIQERNRYRLKMCRD